ncbi:hypothetical protein [Nesterenkonia natronophila]|uniref:Uncharacterized protein n=1 Tax=Nesterenkonia natronophila TaxID=2174932 RepID=A0A3A4F1W4_9MICC|nr:hypothetical protein [Nesterenkonia natronophila]RJN32043.1 hypothetical protein D3250_08120 [Nesterenkonia natronophila]
MFTSAGALVPSLTQWWPGGGGGGESPDLRDGLSEADITPGIEGFLFTLLIVVMLIVVVRDLGKRMRRMKYRTMAEAELAGEEPEFPGEITPAGISEAQQHARTSAAEARFGSAAQSPESRSSVGRSEPAVEKEPRV